MNTKIVFTLLFLLLCLKIVHNRNHDLNSFALEMSTYTNWKLHFLELAISLQRHSLLGLLLELPTSSQSCFCPWMTLFSPHGVQRLGDPADRRTVTSGWNQLECSTSTTEHRRRYALRDKIPVRCQDSLYFLWHCGDEGKERLSVTFHQGWGGGRGQEAWNQERLPVFTHHWRNPESPLAAMDVPMRRAGNLMFAIRNTQEEKCSWHSYTATSATFLYRN